MSAQANITLADGQVSPVNVVFYANGVQSTKDGSAVATYKSREASGIGIAAKTLTLVVRETPTKIDVDRRITTPVLEVISGSDGGYTPKPKVAYNLFSREQFALPARSSLAERKDLLAFSKNLNADAVMQSAVWNFEPVW